MKFQVPSVTLFNGLLFGVPSRAQRIERRKPQGWRWSSARCRRPERLTFRHNK